jgi:Aspartyl/Asparaginyl beta-hydroxylase
MNVGLKLPFQFDAVRLKADLASVAHEEWTPHYNQQDFGGEWRGLALRSPTGRLDDLSAPFTNASTFVDTPLMTRCCYFREAASMFQCPLKAVRLLSLEPGSFIREHTDNALVYEDGEMRIHIPVQTSAQVEFYVAGERLRLDEGSSYYINVNLPHRITNRGGEARIHLILDVEVNDWVHKLVWEAREQGAAIPRMAPPERNFDDFASLVLDEPGLREALSSYSEASEFVEATLCAARDRGFDVSQADVEAALHVNFLNGAPVRRVPRFEPEHSKIGWTPAQAHFRTAGCFLEWIYTGARRFTEPFFADSVRACLRNPFSVAFRQESRLDSMEETELAAQAIPPSGFIFHMSRCGSTLVGQMLASSPRAVVLSEPAPVDDILQAHLRLPGLTFDEQAAWVRRTVLALGQPRTGSETHYFVTLDAWDVHRLALLRAAFPETPLLFLFRHPEQVLLSHAANPSILSLPGGMPDPHVLGLELADVTRFDRDGWCAAVLTRICESALAWRDDTRLLFVEYENLPGAVYGPIARHFRLELDSEELERMRELARFDSNSGFLSSEGEPLPRDTGRAESVRQLCAGKLSELYAALQTASSRL